MKRLGLGIVLVLIASSLAFAADRDVKTVTTAIEKQYGIKHKGLPLIARMFMKPALWGSGVKLDMAIFEGMPPLNPNALDVESLMRGSLGPAWSPFVRSESRKTGERDVIYVHTAGEKIEMMIVSIEPDEAVVLKLRLKPGEMQKWINEPDEMALHRNHDVAQNDAAPQASKTHGGFVRTGTE